MGSLLAHSIPPLTTDRQHTVLVADDEIGIRTILTVMLRRNGFHVLTAENGSEALALFKEHSQEIGIVLFDVQMPLLSGPAALDQIRKIAPDVRAILTSGLLKQEFMERYPVEPPWTFLAKPFAFCDVDDLFPKAA